MTFEPWQVDEQLVFLLMSFHPGVALKLHLSLWHVVSFL